MAQINLIVVFFQNLTNTLLCLSKSCFRNHVACASGYNSNFYPSLRPLNTQTAEQRNSQLRRVRFKTYLYDLWILIIMAIAGINLCHCILYLLISFSVQVGFMRPDRFMRFMEHLVCMLNEPTIKVLLAFLVDILMFCFLFELIVLA